MADIAEQDNTAAAFEQRIDEFTRRYDRIVEQVRSVIVGQQHVIDKVLCCLLVGGHVLVEGVPGLGKTLLVRTLGEALDLSFVRIQFTPDLMPADITGTNIIVADDGPRRFRFEPGPIFANLVLADEINRATPKTQSAVLEAMQEQTVSVSRTTHQLPQPFCVLATQNPLEMEGTYPLPEAQLDRFMFKVLMAGPSVNELTAILDRTTGTAGPAAQKAADGKCVLTMRALVREVAAAGTVNRYISRLVLATHPDSAESPQIVQRYVRYGASPRGGQAIMLGAKVLALRDGRANIAFEDVRNVAAAALRHRLILSFEGHADGIEPDSIIEKILQTLPENMQ